MAVKRSTTFVINNKKRDENAPKFETKLTEDIIKQWKKENKWKDTDRTTTGFRIPERPPVKKEPTPRRAPYRRQTTKPQVDTPAHLPKYEKKPERAPRHPRFFEIDERRARYKEVLEAGTPIHKPLAPHKPLASDSGSYNTAFETIHWHAQSGMNIVSIHSAIVRIEGVIRHDTDIWIVDNFKRYKRKVRVNTPNTPKSRTALLKSMFKTGYMIKADKLDFTPTQLKNSLKDLRIEGMDICNVKGHDQGKHGSVIGYILPSSKNGLGKAEMQNAPKAGEL